MILITGATGTIGKLLVAELQARGAPFRVGHCDPDRVRAVLGPEVESIPFDFQDETTHLPAMQSTDRLYLLTPTTDWAHLQAMRVIDAAREAGVSRIVRQSVLHADSHPTYLLADWHREVELCLVASGIPGTILRPNHFMENFANFMGDTIRREGKFYSSSGDQPVSYVAGADVAAVAAECLMTEDHIDKSYDLVGPEAVTQSQVAEAISHATGRHIEYVPVDEQAMRAAMLGVPGYLVRISVELDEFDRTGRMSVQNRNVETILKRPAQDIRSWAAQHAKRFLPETVTV